MSGPSRSTPHPQKAVRPDVPGFHVLQPIGQGSTGVVYRAIQLSMQREVALKILDPRLAAVPGFADRFIHEARSAGAVHHAHVITCYDAGRHGDTVFQALELLSGGDLAQLMAQRGHRCDQAQAIAIILDCALGLEGIHAAGLMHGDIQPANIFIGDDHLAKLGDLGLARSLGAGGGVEELRTSTGRSFVAPEVLRDEIGDIRADIYSLGAVLVWMLTGTAPFLAADEDESSWGGPGDDDAIAWSPDIGDGLRAVVHRAIRPLPQDRYQKPAELREDLERVAIGFSPLHAAPDGLHRRATQALPRPTAAGTGSARMAPGTTGLSDALPSRRLPMLPIALIGLVILAVALFAIMAAVAPSPPSVRDGITPAAAPAPEIVAEPARPVLDWTPPHWASTAGTDAFGRWIEVTVHDVPVRLRYCPAGTFRMGDHRAVTLSRGFWLGQTEVSQALWNAVSPSNPSSFVGDDLPVDSVSWTEAKAFLDRVRTATTIPVRLPSEAEWEYACRSFGPTSRGPSREHTLPVASDPPSAGGFHGLLGNVLEWCEDAYAPIGEDAIQDPVQQRGSHRVARGGAWNFPADACLPMARFHYLPETGLFIHGLRLAISEERQQRSDAGVDQR